MPEIECWRCKETFTYDANDLRPHIYHICSDGINTATKNPNLKKTRQLYIEKKTFKKKETKWQNFNGL